MTPAELLSPLLEKGGFTTRDRRLWLRTRSDSWNLVAVQKSSWGNQYYINVGVWLPVLNPNPAPRVQDCHIQTRLGSIAANASELENALNFEDEWKMDPDQRRFEIHCALRDAESKFFDKFHSLEVIRLFLAGHPAGPFGIQRELVTALQAFDRPE
jgi:hypothetical protein